MSHSIDRMYETAIGMCADGEGAAGIDNLFDDGTICDFLYSEVYDASRRINQRLGQQEDPDVERIIRNLWKINKIVSCKMYEYGVEHGRKANR